MRLQLGKTYGPVVVARRIAISMKKIQVGRNMCYIISKLIAYEQTILMPRNFQINYTRAAKIDVA